MEPDYIKKHSINDIVTILGDRSQHRDFHIHISKNRFDDIPISYPFRTNGYGVIMVLSGKISLQLNLLTYEVGENEMIFTLPNTVIQLRGHSKELEIIIFGFTLGYLLEHILNKNDVNTMIFLLAKETVKINCNLSQARNLRLLLEFLESKMNTQDLYDKETNNLGFNLLLHELAGIYRTERSTHKMVLNRQEDLTLRFFKVLEDNFKKERNVSFYANVLNVSPGHLSKVLKEVSGKSALQLIADILTLEAKVLLSNGELSIAQIAEALDFSDQSTFGKFFKKSTGLSPLQYRRLN